MAPIKTVALAGASGQIGTTVMRALLDANFTVTVLTRPDSTSTFPPGVKVEKVDYDDTEHLTTILKGEDALVCTLGYAAMLKQIPLIDSAIAAGVHRIIPSNFGADPDHPSFRQLPVYGHKVQVEDHLKQKIQGTSTTYSLIVNNQFFDWDLDNNFGVNIKEKKMEIFDGGDIPRTATPLKFVADGVVGVLKHPSETANRVVRLHGASMTQNKLLGMIQRFGGKDGWDISHASTFDREKEGYEMLQNDPANMMAWAIAFLQCSVWGERFGGDFSNNNDNALLGLKELSDAELEEIVRART
jgi:NAD(P)-dependent dehydrogenase (short-subunit alcohol dehydrogenase family)